MVLAITTDMVPVDCCLCCRFITKEQIQLCERLGGAAALTALMQCPLTDAVDADGSSSSSNGNGNGKSHALPADAYVWVRPHAAPAVVKSQV
jgi:hypothetical protein